MYSASVFILFIFSYFHIIIILTNFFLYIFISVLVIDLFYITPTTAIILAVTILRSLYRLSFDEETYLGARNESICLQQRPKERRHQRRQIVGRDSVSDTDHLLVLRARPEIQYQGGALARIAGRRQILLGRPAS